ICRLSALVPRWRIQPTQTLEDDAPGRLAIPATTPFALDDRRPMVGQSQQYRRRGRRAAVLGFLKTVPGMLTALATMLTGVAGILAALTQVGVIQVRSPIVVGPATTTTVAQAPVLPAPTTSVEFPAAIDQTAPAPAPGGVVTTYLADLEPTQSSRLASTDEANINGKTFVHNVLFYACCDPASADYDLGRHYRRLEATLGVTDEAPADARSTFEVFLDGRKAYTATAGLVVGAVTRLRPSATRKLASARRAARSSRACCHRTTTSTRNGRGTPMPGRWRRRARGPSSWDSPRSRSPTTWSSPAG